MLVLSYVIFLSSFDIRPPNLLNYVRWATMTWGVLAACMDPQPDVQAAAVDSIFLQLLPPSSGHLEV